MTRSVNVELELEAGDYEVRVKINATRDQDILPIEKVIKDNAKTRREKLLRIGLAYDLGHCKGRFVETPEERDARKEHEQKIKQKKKDKIRAKLLKEREEEHYLATQQFQRSEHKRLKNKEKLALKKAAQKAKLEARKAEKAAIKAEKAAQKALARAEAEVKAVEDQKDEEVIDKPEASEATKNESADDSKEEKAESKPEEPMTPESTADEDHEEKPDEKDATEVEEPVTGDKEEAEKAEDSASSSSSEEETVVSEDEDVESVGSLAELADREVWIHVDKYTGTVSDSESDSSSDSEAESEAEKDPWNAVVVAGIRIFHTGLGEGEDDSDINLKAIRPIPFGKDNDEMDPEKKCSTKVLDVDDSAKDATLVGNAQEKIRFIKGDSARRRTATSIF
jgi:hypothetical protein